MDQVRAEMADQKGDSAVASAPEPDPLRVGSPTALTGPVTRVPRARHPPTRWRALVMLGRLGPDLITRSAASGESACPGAAGPADPERPVLLPIPRPADCDAGPTR